MLFRTSWNVSTLEGIEGIDTARNDGGGGMPLMTQCKICKIMHVKKMQRNGRAMHDTLDSEVRFPCNGCGPRMCHYLGLLLLIYERRWPQGGIEPALHTSSRHEYVGPTPCIIWQTMPIYCPHVTCQTETSLHHTCTRCQGVRGGNRMILHTTICLPLSPNYVVLNGKIQPGIAVPVMQGLFCTHH